MNTSKLNVEAERGRVNVGAERGRVIDEALKASGAGSLELLAEPERNKEHIDKLCAKLEALPKVVKKKTRGDDCL